MNFKTILKGRTTQILVLASTLALAGAAHAQSYGSEDRGSGGSSGSTSGQQMPQDDYHKNLKDKNPHKQGGHKEGGHKEGGHKEGGHKDAQREQLERHVEGAKRRDDAQKLDPGKYVPGSPANQ